MVVSWPDWDRGVERGRSPDRSDYSALPHTLHAVTPKPPNLLTHQIKRELSQPSRWSMMRPWQPHQGGCMSSVRKEEARRAILSEYDGWAKKHPDDAILMGGFLFFRYLQNERSDLLDFRAVGSKWQIVHGWIRDRVND
jgi:hypothetical protein